jgi:ABC-2 type transport system ATP-binding protein
VNRAGAAAPAPVVRADRLTKRYGSFTALQDFSLEVGRGEIVALVGPNGAGKTTALSLLVGLLQPTAGSTVIAGYDLRTQPLEAKRVSAFLPDQPFLYEQLTVGETLGFVGGIYRMDPSRLRARAGELLGLFGLAGLAQRRVGQLSFGMKSRLALVLSLLHEPAALIMDEPFFGLDPLTLRFIKTLLQQRAKDGMGVLLSTHQLGVVQDLAHRVAILHGGRLLAIGTLAELKQRHGGDDLEEIFFHFTDR